MPQENLRKLCTSKGCTNAAARIGSTREPPLVAVACINRNWNCLSGCPGKGHTPSWVRQRVVTTEREAQPASLHLPFVVTTRAFSHRAEPFWAPLAQKGSAFWPGLQPRFSKTYTLYLSPLFPWSSNPLLPPRSQNFLSHAADSCGEQVSDFYEVHLHQSIFT